MPPFWHGLNSFQRSIASDSAPSGIFRVAVNVPVFLISSTSMSTVPLAGRRCAAALSMWSQPGASLRPPTM